MRARLIADRRGNRLHPLGDIGNRWPPQTTCALRILTAREYWTLPLQYCANGDIIVPDDGQHPIEVVRLEVCL
jgi:hypothetical protein